MEFCETFWQNHMAVARKPAVCPTASFLATGGFKF